MGDMRHFSRIAVASFGCLVLLAAPACADITWEQADQIVQTFQARAARGALQQPTLVTPNTGGGYQLDPPEIHQDIWTVWLGNAMCVLRRSDGKIEHFVLHPDVHPELDDTYTSRPALPLSQILAIANEYLVLAGWTDTYQLHTVEVQFPDRLQDACYRLHLRAVREGAVLLDYVELELEPTTGFLRRLASVQPPSWPVNLTPATTADAARTVIADYALSAKGISTLIENDPVVLGVWRPQTWPGKTDIFLTPEQIQMGLNYQGMLVYSGSFWDEDTFEARWGFSRKRFTAHVDALTGQLLNLDYEDDWPFGGDSAPSKTKRTRLAWDLYPGPTTVLTGKTSARVADGDVVNVYAPAKAPVGIPFILNRARLTFTCRYDRASGLLWRQQGSRRVYGKPNKSLRAAILRVLKAPAPWLKPRCRTKA